MLNYQKILNLSTFLYNKGGGLLIRTKVQKKVICVQKVLRIELAF